MSISLSKAVKQKILSKLNTLNTNIDKEDNIICYQSSNANTFFQNKRKLLGNDVYEEFIKLVEMFISINNKYKGESMFIAKGILNNKDEVIFIKENLLSIVKQYCEQRINKPNSKDIDKNTKFSRLIDEFSKDLYKFSSLENTLNMYFLGKCIRYIFNYFLNSLICESKYESINIKRVLELIKLPNTKKENIDEIKKEIEIIKDDILHKKQYLIYKDIPIKNIEIIPNKIYLDWEWSMENNNISQIYLTNHPNMKININHKGHLVDAQNDLCDISEMYMQNNDIRYFELNIFLMRKIQLHILSICPKEIINSVDNYFVLLQPMQDAKKVQTIEKITKDNNSLKGYKIKSKTKWGKFLNYLYKNFNVVKEQGKGDDKKIYIKNSSNDEDKIYRTSQIKAQKDILPKTQENILKIIGISQQDWLSKIALIKLT